MERRQQQQESARRTIPRRGQIKVRIFARQQQQQEAERRTIPRRGQIKVRIFASLFRCIIPKAPARKEGGNSGKNKDGSSHRRVSPGG